MWRNVLCASVLVGIAASMNSAVGRDPAKTAPAKVATTMDGDLVIGEPIRHGNLTIFPISSRAPRTESRFITLDEGLKAGTVKIMETRWAGYGSFRHLPNKPVNPISGQFVIARKPSGSTAGR